MMVKPVRVLKSVLVIILITIWTCTAHDEFDDAFMESRAKEELQSSIWELKCRDLSDECEEWVSQGFCKGNETVSAMVIELCQKSCQLCGSREKCHDVNALCPTWKKAGFCTRDDVIPKGYMEEHCKFSCELCKAACHDETVNCDKLAKRGHCSANRPWMKQHCQKSCRFCASHPECGVSNLKCSGHRRKRILSDDHDTEVEQKQVPWMVYIELVETEVAATDEFCGGAIISQRWVLTAAHCLLDDWDVLRLSFGSTNRYTPERYHRLHQSIDSSNVIKHPDFDQSHNDHDIALINLNRDLIFSENIQPICLGPYEEDITGKMVIVTGWGHKKQGGKASEHLLKACVEVKPCSRWEKEVKLEITDNMICAHTHGNDACQGDSGGPMVMETDPGNFIMVGIISQGKGCGTPGVPGIYTNVAKYISWIASITEKGQY